MTHSALQSMKLASLEKYGVKALDCTSVSTQLILSSMLTLPSNTWTLQSSSLLNMVIPSWSFCALRCSLRSSMVQRLTTSNSFTRLNRLVFTPSPTTVSCGSTTKLQWSTMLSMFGNRPRDRSLRSLRTAFLLTGSAANASYHSCRLVCRSESRINPIRHALSTKK